jgi:hypothetical protein
MDWKKKQKKVDFFVEHSKNYYFCSRNVKRKNEYLKTTTINKSQTKKKYKNEKDEQDV